MQELALVLGLKIAYSDGYFDPAEEKMFDDFLNCTDFDKTRFHTLKRKIDDENLIFDFEQLQEYSKFENVIKSLLYKASKVTSGKLQDRIKSEYNRFLLNGPEYKEAIIKSYEVAKEDLEVSRKYISENNERLNHFTSQIQEFEISKKSSSHYDNEFQKELDGFINQVKENFTALLDQLKEHNSRTLHKKERAINYYTIAFIGKTKAGKSTLHTIMTGTGDEFIGKGQQRTTRYNRVYEWDNIRIIDTPGIGAPGGKTDEDIAKSIIEEADLICYVLKNDSQQESEFKFLKTIRDNNKPIVILLNVKENISNEKRMERFLKEPDKWFTRKDHKSIDGHINRIRDYAKQYYKNDYFDIYPVQLLSAQLSMDNQYRKNHRTLYDASRIQEFLDSIRIQVIEQGIIKRSQNILDGTTNILVKELSEISKRILEARQLTEKLEKNKNRAVSEIKKNFDRHCSHIENEMKSAYSNLKQKHVVSFANSNFTTKKKIINDKWQDYIRSIDFEGNINRIIKKTMSQYQMDFEEALNEFQEDMSFSMNQSLGKMEIDKSGIFNFKRLGSILGELAMLTGSIFLVIAGLSTPVGWVLTGIGAVLTIGSNLFLKNKEDRVDEAKKKIVDSLISQIEKSESKIIEKTLTDFTENHHNALKRFNGIINSITKENEIVIKLLEEIRGPLERDIDELNVLFAKRILKHIDYEHNKNLIVERDFGSKIKIDTGGRFNEKLSNELTTILQEKVELS